MYFIIEDYYMYCTHRGKVGELPDQFVIGGFRQASSFETKYSIKYFRSILGQFSIDRRTGHHHKKLGMDGNCKLVGRRRSHHHSCHDLRIVGRSSSCNHYVHKVLHMDAGRKWFHKFHGYCSRARSCLNHNRIGDRMDVKGQRSYHSRN